ncbi:btb (poz) domain-containing 2a-related [Anaeramoeba flamelloides]|uniref:Btb (Poz) domain-containing 2a-related n=1 Tax=Anaeramoeba flamelloides TaxID=1746091 RepID=A0ABQ8Y0W3_9EUKA|nr:btb (poz) domain-containing 2a-related [Anaeramoeba flamelloides]
MTSRNQLIPKSQIILSEKYSKYINNSKYADVLFLVGEESTKIYAHKFILASTSPIWAQECFPKSGSVPSLSNPISVPSISPQAFLCILNYAYTSRVDLTMENALGVLQASGYYELGDLKTKSAQWLTEILNADNCCVLLEQSLKVDSKFLRDQCIGYIEKNSLEILTGSKEQISTLSKETIIEIYSLKKLIGISEIELFRVAVQWATKSCKKKSLTINTENLRGELEGILDHIQFQLMSKLDLEQVLESKLLPEHQLLSVCFQIINKTHTPRFRKKKKRKHINVLLLSAESNSSWAEDVKSQLKSGGFNKIDTFRGEQETPSLEYLEKFDCVFTFSQMNYHNSVLLGDILHEYVCKGGGVVISTFATEIQSNKDNEINTEQSNVENEKSLEIKGKLVSKKFLPFISGDKNYGTNKFLGDYDKLHPLLENVSRFSGGASSYRSNVKANKNSKVVAKWNDGVPLIGVKQVKPNFGTIVELNFFPVSSNCRSDFWDVTTDGAIILCNAVSFVSPH